MALTVPDKVLLDSINCPDNYSCLFPEANSTRPLCEVDFSFGENLMFIKALNLEPCWYRFSFGNVHICKCPTHFFINKNEGAGVSETS